MMGQVSLVHPAMRKGTRSIRKQEVVVLGHGVSGYPDKQQSPLREGARSVSALSFALFAPKSQLDLPHREVPQRCGLGDRRCASRLDSPYPATLTLLRLSPSYTRESGISLVPEQPRAALMFRQVTWKERMDPACEDRPCGEGSLGKEWEGRRSPRSDSGACAQRLRPN